MDNDPIARRQTHLNFCRKGILLALDDRSLLGRIGNGRKDTPISTATTNSPHSTVAKSTAIGDGRKLNTAIVPTPIPTSP